MPVYLNMYDLTPINGNAYCLGWPWNSPFRGTWLVVVVFLTSIVLVLFELVFHEHALC